MQQRTEQRTQGTIEQAPMVCIEHIEEKFKRAGPKTPKSPFFGRA
jgi:hypothetical protein